MSKLSQLKTFRRLGLPTAPFAGVSYEAFAQGEYAAAVKRLRFPVVVRSSFAAEDGATKSLAGQFETVLDVARKDLGRALERVFASYPAPEGQKVIVQEMLQPEVSGVLFAYHAAMWKVECALGSGEALMGGRLDPHTLLLPKFQALDRPWSLWFNRWRPFSRTHELQPAVSALIALSVYAGQLLAQFADEAPHGLDIEFAVVKGRCFLLQARPITTGQEAEEVLTSANHKEILPPYPSPLMTAVIASCSAHLFAYYQRLDPSLPTRNFIEISGGMPWINLSALLDTMVAWGLPTALVCDSVGAEDFYQVKFRPWVALRKWPVFIRVLREQLTITGRTRRWVRTTWTLLRQEIETRRLMWHNSPDLAFTNWLTNLQLVYVELVSLMQALTGSMSGPIKLLARLGLLQHVRAKSESTRYMEVFHQMLAGEISRQGFLKHYGHRGFYESDIGQKRFGEFSEMDWEALVPEGRRPAPPAPKARGSRLLGVLFKPYLRMLHTREWLRNQAMRFFFMLREELQEQTQGRLGAGFDFSRYRPEDLSAALEGRLSREALEALVYPPQTGWDLDTFLWNRYDRRLPLSHLSHLAQPQAAASPLGLGIYPGRVKGQIWRVDQAELDSLQRPPFTQTILLTDSLDPGWIPYFVQVNGVLSHVGGILSHASIILRESHIPAITQLPRQFELETGDWVEMDGRTGEVRKLNGDRMGRMGQD